MMAATELIKIMQEIASDTIRSEKPVMLTFGTVTKAPPHIEIKINEKITLDEDMLLLTSAVKDYNIEISTNITTDRTANNFLNHTHGGEGDSSVSLPHQHNITGKHCITVHNALEVGDVVLLMRMQGGNSFVVLDAVKRKRSRTLS